MDCHQSIIVGSGGSGWGVEKRRGINSEKEKKERIKSGNVVCGGMGTVQWKKKGNGVMGSEMVDGGWKRKKKKWASSVVVMEGALGQKPIKQQFPPAWQMLVAVGNGRRERMLVCMMDIGSDRVRGGRLGMGKRGSNGCCSQGDAK